MFEAILDCATRLFGSAVAAVYRYDGRVVGPRGDAQWPAKALAMAQALYPAPADRAQLAGRAILTAKVQALDDALTDPSYNHAFAAAGAWRRVMGAPMLKDGVAVGAILVGWPEAGHTPPRQIELIRTFADQAVIAIENVRLLNETKEALERQTATAEILQRDREFASRRAAGVRRDRARTPSGCCWPRVRVVRDRRRCVTCEACTPISDAGRRAC